MFTFDWDENKASANYRKHGVSFGEAATVFSDPLAHVVDDPVHSDTEDRYIVLGRSEIGRNLVVSFTERGDLIRIISARQMTPREKRVYEQSF